MTSIRYVGTSGWERTHVDDKGKFLKSEHVEPGAVVEGLNEDVCKKILAAPRFMRSFVEVNGPEDRYGDNYGGNRYDVQGNATAYPELDMGSTVTPRRAITRTVDDNPEGFDLAGTGDGPGSDNADLILRNEAVAEGNAAYEKKVAEQKKSSSSRTSSTGSSSASASRSEGSEGRS